jgi:hypothetical protein
MKEEEEEILNYKFDFGLCPPSVLSLMALV